MTENAGYHPHHNISFGDEGNYYQVAFDKVRDNLSRGLASVYAIQSIATEDTRAAVIRGMEKVGIDNVAQHVESGMIVLIDNNTFYSKAGLNTQALKNYWRSILANMNRKLKSSYNGVSALFSAESYVNRNLYDTFMAWEILEDRRPAVQSELFCWYKKQWLDRLSFIHLVRLFTSHNSTVHKNWNYKDWSDSEIVDLIEQGIERILGPKPTQVLIETVRMRYGLSREEIASRPEYFESILHKMLEDDASTILDSAADVLKKALAYEAIHQNGRALPTGKNRGRPSDGRLG